MSTSNIVESNSVENAGKSSENIYNAVCHSVNSDRQLKRRERNRLVMASALCLIFMVIEVVGGFLANSLALMSDAAHLLSDFSSFLVSLFALWISSKPRTRYMSFGFYRAEVLGALLSILLIWLVTGILVYLAIARVVNKDYDLEGAVMMYVSLAGIFANLIMGISLVVYAGDRIYCSFEGSGLNVRSAAIHVLGDLFQSVGVFIASVVVYFRPEWKIADPICTFIFSVIVLFTTLNIMQDIIRVLMEGFPKHLDFDKVKRVLYSVEGVESIHSLRIWMLSLDRGALSAHIVVKNDANPSEVLQRVSEEIHKQLNIYEVTLQMEETGNVVCSMCV